MLISLVIIFGSGYFYLNYKNNPPNFIPPPDKQKDSLETYTNKDLGFKFEYSKKNLVVKEDSEEEFNKRGNGEFRKNFTAYVAYPPADNLGAVVVLEKEDNFETNPFTLWVFNNPNKLDIEQFYENYWYYPFVWGDYTARRDDVAPKGEATISGQLAQYGIVTYQPGSPKFIYLASSEKMYLFRIIGEEGEKILQTVKVVENIGGCFVAGCSNQLCVDEEEKDIVTTCEFREEYECYKDALCERQKDGGCGWTQTKDLLECIEQKRGSE
ncbi:MAG: hypothetical protein Q8P92_05775 [Candidatus Daviesbacteria bacterium]|nr:hypothetical protein [Candidatus Daviesbacteria bacterium]